MDFTMYAGFSHMIGQVGIDKAAEYAKDLGFTSVELLSDCYNKQPDVISDVTAAKKASAILKQKELTPICYSVYANLWKDEDALRHILHLVEIAAALEIPYFHHTVLPGTSVATDAPKFEEAIEGAVIAAEQIAKHAEKFGIMCLYEDQGEYVNGVEGFGAFYREMKRCCSNVGVCGDMGNILFVNEKPEDFFAAYAKDICHVHIKDYLQKEMETPLGRYWYSTQNGIWIRETMVGDGVVNLEACMKILKEAGYQGAFALENGHIEPYEIGVRQAMEYAKRFW